MTSLLLAKVAVVAALNATPFTPPMSLSDVLTVPSQNQKYSQYCEVYPEQCKPSRENPVLILDEEMDM